MGEIINSLNETEFEVGDDVDVSQFIETSLGYGLRVGDDCARSRVNKFPYSIGSIPLDTSHNRILLLYPFKYHSFSTNILVRGEAYPQPPL